MKPSEAEIRAAKKRILLGILPGSYRDEYRSSGKHDKDRDTLGLDVASTFLPHNMRTEGNR